MEKNKITNHGKKNDWKTDPWDESMLTEQEEEKKQYLKKTYNKEKN